MAQTFNKAQPGNAILKGITGTTFWNQTTLSYSYANQTADYDYTNANANVIAGLSGTYGAVNNGTTLGLDVEFALDAISSISSLNFVETGNYAASDMKMVGVSNLASPNGGLNGIATFPNTDAHEFDGTGAEAYTLFSLSYSSMTTAPELGGSSNRLHTVLHEIMHSLGFGHPHDTGTGSSILGSTALFGDNVLDNDRYTVMSYERGGIDQNSQSRSYGYAVTPMALDVSAIQSAYGSTHNHQGNTTYTLTDRGTVARDLNGSDGSVSIGRAFYCIWDTGGAKDKIVYNGANHVLINLNQATLNQNSDPGDVSKIIANLTGDSYFNALLPVGNGTELRNDITDSEWHAGGFFSRIFFDNGAAELGGYSIANNSQASAAHKSTTIERATGGNDSDILIGNQAKNMLVGRGGNDLIDGSGGNDKIKGGGGRDHIYGSNGRDVLEGGDGNDVLKGGSGNDKMVGGKGNDRLVGNNGKDNFVFARQDGNDRVIGFQDRQDKIDLTKFNYANKSKALKYFKELGSANDDMLVFQHAGTKVVIKGIDLKDLSGADILI